MCVLFVDKFAGCVLLRVSGSDQTHSEVMEHTGVTAADRWRAIKNGSDKSLAIGRSDFAYSPSLVY